MRTILVVIGLGVVVAVSAALGFAFGLGHGIAESTAHPSFPDQFLRSADKLSLQTDWPARHKRELLAEAAARRQIDLPTSSVKLWEEFQQTLTSSSHPNAGSEQLGKLVGFQDQLEAALINCHEVSDFDRVWDVWLAVERQIGSLRETLLDQLAKSLSDLPDVPKDTSMAQFEQAIQAYSAFTQQSQPSVIILLATASPDAPVDAGLQAISARARDLQKAAKTVVEGEEKQLLELQDELTGTSGGSGTASKKAVRIEPGPLLQKDQEPVLGKCALKIDELAHLEELFQEADLESWAALKRLPDHSTPEATGSKTRARPESSDEGTNAVLGALAGAQQTAFKVQQAAYNLWALREIQTADTTVEESWPGHLARIDPGLLEPPVAALYTSVYSRRIEEFKEGSRRADVVGQFLSSKKVRLSEF